jgi:branched-chain amino acid aminotransferase
MYPKEAYENGLKVIIAESARVPPRSLSANVKSLNYLNNINAYNEMLAYNENNKTDANEAVMLDYDGFIAECTGDNFFMVGFDPEKKRYYIYTPGKRNCLQGITRDVMREICKDQHVLEDYHETDIHPKDLKLKAREIFLTGTAAEIAPVVKVLNAPLGDHKYGELIIGDGKPGPWTKLLREKFIEYTRQPENSTGIYE